MRGPDSRFTFAATAQPSPRLTAARFVSRLAQGTGVVGNDLARNIHIPDELTMPLQVRAAYNGRHMFFRRRWPARQPSIHHDAATFEGGKWVCRGSSVPGPQAQGICRALKWDDHVWRKLGLDDVCVISEDTAAPFEATHAWQEGDTRPRRPLHRGDGSHAEITVLGGACGRTASGTRPSSAP